MTEIKRESLADIMQCNIILEEKAYSLYKNLADKVDIPLVKSLLLVIAYDSQKHAAIFRGISESVGKPTKSWKDYEKRLGENLNTIDRLEKEIAKKGRMSNKDVSAMVENLTALESTVGEEYFTLVQVKTLQFMTQEIRETYNVNLEDLKDLLESIIRDEDKHERLLSRIKKVLIENENETEEKKRTAAFQILDVQTEDVLDKLANPRTNEN